MCPNFVTVLPSSIPHQLEAAIPALAPPLPMEPGPSRTPLGSDAEEAEQVLLRLQRAFSSEISTS